MLLQQTACWCCCGIVLLCCEITPQGFRGGSQVTALLGQLLHLLFQGLPAFQKRLQRCLRGGHCRGGGRGAFQVVCGSAAVRLHACSCLCSGGDAAELCVDGIKALLKSLQFLLQPPVTSVHIHSAVHGSGMLRRYSNNAQPCITIPRETVAKRIS